VATNDDDLAATLKFHQYAIGAVPGPWTATAASRTQDPRRSHGPPLLERACRGAVLSSHPAVEKVYYPGLEGHSGHEIAAQQMSDFGGMVSFTLKAGAAAARKTCESTKTFTLAESLGGVEASSSCPPS